MAKRVICFALGGHISSQNASFRRLAEILEPKKYKFFGAKDGFKAFETGEVYELHHGEIPRDFSGFVAGANRDSLTTKDGCLNEEKLSRAIDFFKAGRFDVAVASGGDDHGKQMAILQRGLEKKVQVFVLNKTMDNDLGGEESYTDFTNGFHTAVKVGANMIRRHFAGAWTNNMPYLIGHFGRETNWVGIALSYYGFADRFIYGELPETHQGHPIDKIHELILESQDRNERKYGRRFAMIDVAEGTRISGIEHVSRDLMDAHGHHKMQPEVLVTNLKIELEKKYNMKTQTTGITYEMRNLPPTREDIRFAEKSAEVIADSILDGMNGFESVFKIRDGEIYTGVDEIERVSEKRYAGYYPGQLFNPETFEVTEEIGKYYATLFGKRGDLGDLLPGKLKTVNVFARTKLFQ